MTTITIVDQSTMGENRAWSLDILEKVISLRELIRQRIYQEVTEYNTRQTEYFHGLVQPTEAELMLNGSRSKAAQQLDWQVQYEKAIEAFAHLGYIVLVNEKQIIDLDAKIELDAGTEITFFKLIPLIGG